MHVSESSRNFVKQALWWTRIKLVYARITLTKYTTFFFFLALVNCVVLIVLQAIAFSDNSQASKFIGSLLDQGNITRGLVIVRADQLQYCHDIPARKDANCTVLSDGTLIAARGLSSVLDFVPRMDIETDRDSSGKIDGVTLDGQLLDRFCLNSLLWVNEVVSDAQREDVVTMLFQVWLLSISVVAILNESIPHLVTTQAAHVLLMAWSIYRICQSAMMEKEYKKFVLNDACRGVDPLGNWWNVRLQHNIPIIVVSAVTLLISAWVAFRLFKVYAKQTLDRVSSKPKVHFVYKLVLFFSVCLQLSAFFVLASTGLWIDKVSNGMIRQVAQHLTIYQAAFAVIAVFELPWLVLGWHCVRKESRKLFAIFLLISVLIFAVSSSMFASPLYHFLLDAWPFFATLTIASYVLVFFTTVVSILCRLHFGLGLTEHLNTIIDDDDGADFAPVTSLNEKASDAEKSYYSPNSDVQALPPLSYPKQPVSVLKKSAATGQAGRDKSGFVVTPYPPPPGLDVNLPAAPDSLQIPSAPLIPRVRAEAPSSGAVLAKKGGLGLPSNPRPNPKPASF